MKRFCILMLIWVISMPLLAQQIRVSDVETGQAIEKVLIHSKGSSQLVITDEKGIADIGPITSDQLEIEKLGYTSLHLSKEELRKMDFKVALKLKGVALDELIISSSRFLDKDEEVVQKIQVIRKSEIEQMNQSSMADVIAGSGNIMVQKSQLGGGSPVIRGFEANKVLMVIDGVRMNNAIYRAGHLQNVVTLDNASMDRVELVYGPGSVMYGSDALGGVMHFMTKNPSLSSDSSLLVKAGAYSRYMSALEGSAYHLDFSLGKKRFGCLSSMTYTEQGDLRQGAKRNPFYGDFGARDWYVQRLGGVDSVLANTHKNVQVGSAYSQLDLMQKFMFKASDNTLHRLNIQYSTSSNVPRYDRLTQGSMAAPRFAEWYYGPQKRLFAAYTLSMENKRYFDRSRFTLAYQDIEESRVNRRYRNDVLKSQIEEVSVFSMNLDMEKDLADHELRYGVEAYSNVVASKASARNILSNELSPSDTRYPDGGSTMNSAAVYITHLWKISDHFLLNDGLRFNYLDLNSKFKDKSFFPFPFDQVTQQHTVLNGNLGLIYSPEESWKIRVNFATGFRSPNVDDMSKVFETAPGSVIVPNPDLKPEHTYNAEIGISKTLNERVNISASTYYTWYENALRLGPAKFQGADSILYDGQMSKVFSTLNTGKAYIYGFEGMIIGNLNQNLSVRGTVNYTYGRIVTDSLDQPLDHIPPVFGKLLFHSEMKKWSADYYLNYSAWKRRKDYNLNGEDNLPYATAEGMPAWFTLNAGLKYAFTEHASLHVACENILDQNYRVFASNISAPGRNLIVTLRAAF